MRRVLFAVIAVLVMWSVLDMIIHGFWLMPIYEATKELWRLEEEMKMPLMYLVTLIYTIIFVTIYNTFVHPKSLAKGVTFGTLFGLGAGISMGFGSYCYMPIPLTLAGGWFLGTLVEAVIAGALVGTILKS